MTTISCDDVMDELDGLVSGDSGAMARCGEHLAGCDACRDARHDAERVADKMRFAGADYVAPVDLMERVMAAVEGAKPATSPLATTLPLPMPVTLPTKTATTTTTTKASSKRRVWVGAAVGSAIAAGVVGVVAMSTTGGGGSAPA